MAAYVNVPISRHIFLWIIGMSMVVYLHSKNNEFLIKISKVLFIMAILFLLYTNLKGTMIKGSKRWISIGGMSIQPSELLKTSIVILSSHYLYRKRYLAFFFIYFISIILLLKQPDFGSSILLLSIMSIQLFISELDGRYLFFLIITAATAIVLSYYFLPHVQNRIHNFVYGKNLALSGGYQGLLSVKAISSGKLLGKGIGKGTIKNYLPDSFSDFIFAVIAEELGFIGCAYVICTFIFLAMISFNCNVKLAGTEDYYINTSCTSLILIQAWINIASSLWLIPTKGLTLPFISHGGTSLLISFITISALFISDKKAKFKRNIRTYMHFPH
ncbi:MAG: FtsW/RodA/SpoVE family cell cycle protein [Alphaproteobacteria bacterium]|nr:MAG: FtsW/RodA/SpoVE family cell cycle protein [Alphaproteobacteria bacterium]